MQFEHVCLTVPLQLGDISQSITSLFLHGRQFFSPFLLSGPNKTWKGDSFAPWLGFNAAGMPKGQRWIFVQGIKWSILAAWEDKQQLGSVWIQITFALFILSVSFNFSPRRPLWSCQVRIWCKGQPHLPHHRGSILLSSMSHSQSRQRVSHRQDELWNNALGTEKKGFCLRLESPPELRTRKDGALQWWDTNIFLKNSGTDTSCVSITSSMAKNLDIAIQTGNRNTSTWSSHLVDFHMFSYEGTLQKWKKNLSYPKVGSHRTTFNENITASALQAF